MSPSTPPGVVPEADRATSAAPDLRGTPVLVVGAGIMGAGIVQVAALAGHRVRLYDVGPGAAQQARDKLARTLATLVDKGRLEADAAEAAVARIEPVAALEEAADAGLVIEAIVERLDAKRALFQQLEAIVGPGAVLATNTSSISVTAIANGMKLPGRLVGMHFFNPVPLMKLVEVVSGLQTSPAVADAIFQLGGHWGKVSVHAQSTPGFIVNRVARPFYAETLALLQERAATPAVLDACLRGAGFRMGPCELIDLIGHDTNFAVTQSVYEANFFDKRYVPSGLQREMVAGGLLGRKSGQGFFRYGDGGRPVAAVAGVPGAGSVGTPVAPTVAPPVAAAPIATPVAAPLTEPVIGLVGALASPTGAEVGQGTTNPVAVEGTVVHGDGNSGLQADFLRHAGAALAPLAGPLVQDAESAWSGLALGTGRLVLTDGRTAQQLAAELGIADVAVVDLPLVRPPVAGTVLAYAVAPGAGASWNEQVPRWLAALGYAPQRMADAPGLVVARTVAMLINEAADAVLQGVCDPAGADAAMKLGVNYPAGPFEWLERWGVAGVIGVLQALDAEYRGERYRVSPWLRRRSSTGTAGARTDRLV